MLAYRNGLRLEGVELLHPVVESTPYQDSSTLRLQNDKELLHFHVQITALQKPFAFQCASPELLTTDDGTCVVGPEQVTQLLV